MRQVAAIIFCLLIGCTSHDPVQEAKDVIRSHEEYVTAGKLDAIVSNFADDIVILAPGMPLVEGNEACREMYAGMLEMGEWEFSHDYHGAELVGDVVVLHGLAEGKTTGKDGTITTFANNFIIVFKYGSDGKLKFWRVAFASNSQ